MQPYFVPYIGYFQLMNAVDEFVVYDNIQFSKAGWIQRNRILVNGTDRMISLPLQRGSDFLAISQRELAASFPRERDHLLRQIEAAYRKAPYFSLSMPIIVDCLEYDERNLFSFLWHSLSCICDYLGLTTPMVVSSTVPIDHSLRGKDKVIAICAARAGSYYINSIGGTRLYSRAEFQAHGIDLSFLQTRPISYAQFQNQFVANLSIIDVMMFNSPDQIRTLLGQYDLVNP